MHYSTCVGYCCVDKLKLYEVIIVELLLCRCGRPINLLCKYSMKFEQCWWYLGTGHGFGIGSSFIAVLLAQELDDGCEQLLAETIQKHRVRDPYRF